jgi:hypothetical protein
LFTESLQHGAMSDGFAVDYIIDFARARRILWWRESGCWNLPEAQGNQDARSNPVLPGGIFMTAAHNSGECLGENRGYGPRI